MESESKVDASKGDVSNLDEELPAALENARQDWMTTLQAYAVVEGLFLGFEVTMLSLIKTSPNDVNIISHPHAFRTLLFFTYAAVIINVAGVLASMMLVHDLTAIPDVRRRQKAPTPFHGLEDTKRSIDVLGDIASAEGWHGFVWRFRSWLLISWLGPISVAFQFMLYFWLHETWRIAMPLSIVVLTNVVPLVRYPAVGRPSRGVFFRENIGGHIKEIMAAWTRARA